MGKVGTMPGKAAIILGNSHLSSVILHLQDRPAEVYGSDDSIQYYVFDTVKHGAGFPFSIDSGGGRYILNPAVLEMIKAKVPADREILYISMYGGNAHNVLTLKEHPRPFDFVVPWRQDLPIDNNRELVSFAYIHRFLKKLTEAYELNMTTLQNAARELGGHAFHFQSPPPVRDNAFILHHLEDWFKSDQPVEVAAPLLRYKMWLAHSKIIADYCSGIGMEFLETPQSAKDRDGYLLEEHGRDSTHAGPSFGKILLNQFEQRLGLRYDGWAWL